MTEITPREYETLDISRRALQALSWIEGLTAGALSPLARMQATAGEADPGALIAAWGTLEGAWKWAIPALLDPHRTIALVMGDGNTNLIGQYLFPDAEAWGPGFNVDVAEGTVSLKGPVSLGMLKATLYMHLMLEDIAYVEPFSILLAEEPFWALMACLDAYRAAALARRLVRDGGAPSGVGLEVISRAWTDGISRVNPGWAVSLFALLASDRVPPDLTARLPQLLREMSRQGHLREMADPEGTLYTLPEALSPLLWGPTAAFNFGLVTQRIAAPRAVESTVLGGWRTPGGIWLADLSEMDTKGVTVLLAGPALATGIIDDVLGDDALAPPWEEFAMETPYMRDDLVSRLRAVPEGGQIETAATGAVPQDKATAPRAFCTSCGNPLGEGLAFCNKCGKPVGKARPSKASCTACGNTLGEGLAFCNKCGKPV